MTITTCIFDAYGTLFDISAAAREAAAEPGRVALAACWQKLAADWRTKQLQYTWHRALVREHREFWLVTQDGLDWALENNGLAGDGDLRDRLLKLYWELTAYPEVPAMLANLKDMGMNTAILSNGSPAMLEGAVTSAGLNEVLDDTLSVEEVGVFKPAPEVYELVTRRFECPPRHVLFVSSNCWDALAARGYRFQAVWVNRAGEPLDRLGHTPRETLSDLAGIPDLAKEF